MQRASRGTPAVLRHGAVAMAVAALAGCAMNPMVAWQPPAEAAADTKMPAPLDTMESARGYALAYKRALQQKAYDYVGAQGQLNDALLGLGLLTLGTLASTAHKDVPLVLGGLFGGTYLYGQQNLGKPRLEVYQTGIGATNCALAAVAPLNFSTSELQAVDGASKTLATRDLPEMARWLSVSRTLYAESGIAADQRAAIDRQLEGAAATYQAALELLHDSSQLPGRVSAAAAGLKGSVDVIAAQVDKLASNTVVDPASVSRSLGGLAAIVGSVAPGAGLDQTFTSRINPSGPASRGTPSSASAQIAGEGTGGSPQAREAPSAVNLTTALSRLAASQARVDAQVKYLGGRIATSKGFGNGAADALKACNVLVPDTMLALRIDPQSVEIRRPTGDPVQAEVAVTGGAKNYSGRFTQTAAGVELITPRAGEGTFVIKVAKDADQKEDLTLQLRIEDSSNPPQAKLVPVKIAAPAAAQEKGNPRAAGKARR